jgi:RimJ/RimL family protein N-acetyltransferase
MLSLIITDRLSLRVLAGSDSQFILTLVNTDGWQKFIGNRDIHSEADAVSYVRNIIENPQVNYWVVRLQTNDAPIGVITFIKRDYLQYPDIGFAFLPEYAKTGYAYEAMSALLEHITDQAIYTQICAVSQASNPPIKLLNKLGFQFLKEIELEKERLQVYEASVDRIIITRIAKLFYSVFENRANKQPNFDLLKQICIPEVLITNKHGTEAEVFDLASFIETTRHILLNGTVTEFDDEEIFEETKIVKNIASRFSEYRKTGIVFRQKFQVTGDKFFQFVRINHSWKISSILWSDNEKLRRDSNG